MTRLRAKVFEPSLITGTAEVWHSSFAREAVACSSAIAYANVIIIVLVVVVVVVVIVVGYITADNLSIRDMLIRA